MKKTILCSAACLAWWGAAAVEPVVEGSRYVFTVNEGSSETYATAITGTGVTLVKRGAGKLTLSGAGRFAFSGEIVVEEGVLAAAPEVFLNYDATDNKWVSLGKPDVTVKASACFDCSGTGNKDWGVQVFGALSLAGSGPDGKGSLIRQPRASGNDFPMFSKISLTDDAVIELPGRFRMCSYEGNGHALTVKGTAASSLYFYNVSFDPGEGGCVTYEGGTNSSGQAAANLVFQGGACSFRGTAENALCLKGFGIIVSENTTLPEIPYALTFAKSEGEKSAIINAKADLSLTGPISAEDDMGLAFSSSQGCTLNVAGDFSKKNGTVKTAGNGKVVFSGTVTVAQNKDWGAWEYFQAGETVFSGTDLTWLAGQLMGEPGRRVRFDGAKSVRLGGQYATQLNASAQSRENPYEFVITNSVVDLRSALFLGIWTNGSGMMTLESGSTVTNAAGIHIGGYNSTETKRYGRLVQKGGTLLSKSEINIGFNEASHGFYDLRGGELVLQKNMRVGRSGGSGTFRMTGGVLKAEDDGCMVLGSGYGAFIQSGGWATPWITLGTKDVSGEACGLILLEGAATTNEYATGTFSFEPTNTYAGVFAVNDGAVFSVQRLLKSEAAKAGRSHFTLSLNGGVLRPAWTGPFEVMSGASNPTAPDEVLVHEKGVVIAPRIKPNDDPRWGYGYYASLCAPVGKVVSAVALPTAEAFTGDVCYMGPPQVRIVGSGVGAAAVADYDAATRTVTGIRVVAPGTGYDDTTTAEIASSDNTTFYPCAVTMAAAPETGAGVTVDAEGTWVYFRGANTYRGPTTVKRGRLRLENAQALPEGSDLIVRPGAVLDVNGIDRKVAALEIGGAVSNGTVTVTGKLRLPLDGPGAVMTDGLVLGDGVVVELTGAIADRDPSAGPLLTAESIVCAGTCSVTGVPEGYSFRISAGRITCREIRCLTLIVR